MAMIEVNEQCKSCFHFQVCANVLKQQLFIREKMLKEENLKCENYIPTADVEEVKHGEWLRQNGGFFFLCSNCGKAAATKGNYCHSCGAKMDGGDAK